MVKAKGGKWILLALAGAIMAVASPVHAQFSAGYKFLEAIKKKDGAAVVEALNDPSSTVVNTRDYTTGETALHIVTNRRDLTWMTFLLQRGANANVQDERGITPLEIASNIGFPEGVQLLVDKQARVDQPNNNGETPLITAVHRRDTEIMQILLKAGADPDRADNSGRSAREYAALDGRGSNLIAEIEANAKPRGPGSGASGAYGPTF